MKFNRHLQRVSKKKALRTKYGHCNKSMKLGWNASCHTEDAHSVDHLLNKLWKESYVPALLYKPQGIVDPNISTPKDRSILARQTEFQQDVYLQYASSVVFIDSTHKTDVYDFKLLTLMVIDEHEESNWHNMI